MTALLAVLACVGVSAWLLELRPTLSVDPSALKALPYRIDSYRGHDVPVDPTVARILEADFHVQRTYATYTADPRHQTPPMWLYIGYYGTERGGYTPHTPEACYPAAGWDVDLSSRRQLQLSDELAVNELRVVRGQQRRLVHYWYRSHRATGILGETAQAMDRIVGHLLHGRADGGFVRVSTPVESGAIEAARQRLTSFATRLDSLLETHWPREEP